MNWFELAEDVLIIHGSDLPTVQALRNSSINGIVDVVETDNEIAIQHSLRDISSLVDQIAGIQKSRMEVHDSQVFDIPVCYELGLDWQEVTDQTGLSVDQVIALHSGVEYTTRYGFLPGFLYLAGLNERLNCTRRSSPRKQIHAGSIGIGGDKTGIYSLDSPGGWQIIGRTPFTLFDMRKSEPFSVPNGAKVRFKAISKQQFDEWG